MVTAGMCVMRVLRTILVALSLLIFLVSIFLWGMSCAEGQRLQHLRTGAGQSISMQAIVVGEGSIGLWMYRSGPGTSHGSPGEHEFALSPPGELPAGFLGFRISHESGSQPSFRDNTPTAYEYWYFMIPCALPVFVSGIAPAIVIYRLVRQSRWVAAGKCARCGYDLRGSGGRCPECGLERPELSPSTS